MRMRTATIVSLGSMSFSNAGLRKRGSEGSQEEDQKRPLPLLPFSCVPSLPAFLNDAFCVFVLSLLFLLLPLFRPFLRRLSVSRADLLLRHHRAGVEHPRLAQARHHLETVE